MSNVIVIGIDGSEGSIRAVEYAAKHAKASQSTLKVIHVLEWSPYSFLTPEELEERHARRKVELTRAQTSIVDPVVAKISEGDVNVESEVRYGNVVDAIANFCDEVNASQVFIGRHGGGSKLSSRFFGSVPSNLVQVSKVPVTVVP